MLVYTAAGSVILRDNLHCYNCTAICFMYTGQGSTNIVTLPERPPSASRERYQFRVQLSCADQCHCVTIGNASDSYGQSIHDDWNQIWDLNWGLLCAGGPSCQRNYYSRTFHFHNIGEVVVHVTDDIDASNNNNKICPNLIQSNSIPTLNSFSSTQTTPLSNSTPLTSSTSALDTSTIMSSAELSSSTGITPPSSTAAIHITPSSTDQQLSTTVIEYPTSTKFTSITTTIFPSSTVPTNYSSSNFVLSTLKNYHSSMSQSSPTLTTILPSKSIILPKSTESSVVASTTEQVASFLIPSIQTSVTTPTHTSLPVETPTPTDSMMCLAEGIWNWALACEKSEILGCPNNRLANG